jgi:hypothetical protein
MDLTLLTDEELEVLQDVIGRQIKAFESAT